MRYLISLLLLAVSLFAQAPKSLPADDAVRIIEFYRLADQIQDKVWPGWSKTPAPLVLVTADTEYLTHFPTPPKEFQKVGDDVYARPRQFATNLQATFPAFGFPPVIVIGEPANTSSKTSTPWLITLMHEHFHQMQWAQPEYVKAINDLGLSKGDATGMWMLNYPYPYDVPEIAESFHHLRDTLLATLAEVDQQKFAPLAKAYLKERKMFLGQLLPNDHKYFSFQLWQEGVARYTQIKAAEAAADYQPSTAFAALPDYTPFSTYALTARARTLDELKHIDITQSKREAFYSFGAAEALLLDRLNPEWKDQYFKYLLTTDPLFPTVH
ncbi:MAG TPA: hypothetical protein VMU45_10940 [Candidatus Eisenbacteria bacterium]|nr:hypothetical protein [Candidatus Eisenbacteria bacterium]